MQTRLQIPGGSLTAITVGALFVAPGLAQQRVDTPLPDARPRIHNLTPAEEDALVLELDSVESATSVARQSFGASVVDGQVMAAGPDYRAYFDEGGFEIHPALGRSASHTRYLRFTLESIERGGVPVAALDLDAAPALTSGRVVFDRAPGIAEVYDSLAAGVEQSFLFDTLPAGSGDLVVSGRLSTNLEAPRGLADGTLELRAGELGAIRVGHVIGIDADGDRATGSLASDGEHLELRLPAAFVDRAAMPLVLDPVFGSLVEVEVDAFSDDTNVDVAFDATNQRYLFVWEKWYSGDDPDIHGQLVNTSGAFFGALQIYEGSVLPRGTNPTVANVSTTDSFLVAWQQSSVSIVGPWEITCRRHAASSLGFSSAVDLTSGGNCIEPDAGGERSADDEALVVYNRQGEGIRSIQVNVTAIGTPFVQNEVTVSTDPDDRKPAISKSGGTTGRYVVAWERYFIFDGDHDIVVRGVDRNNNLLGSEFLLASTIAIDEQDPDVDGDGTSFLVAFEREDGPEGTGDNDIHANKLTYVGSTLTFDGGETLVEGDVGDNEVDPAVAFCGPKYYVAWSDEDTGLFGGLFDYDIAYSALDPDDCTLCEIETFVGGSFDQNSRPELAARLSGGDTSSSSDFIALAWNRLDDGLPFDGDIVMQQLDGVGPTQAISNLGGGCGNEGVISVVGEVSVGSPSYEVRIDGGDPTAAIGFLNIAFPMPFVPCDTCLWSPFDVVFTKFLSGGSGSQVLNVPCKPNLAGASVDFQWTMLFTTLSPCSLSANVSLSDILRVTIGA